MKTEISIKENNGQVHQYLLETEDVNRAMREIETWLRFNVRFSVESKLIIETKSV